jgi:FkbM family methyltransferase
MTRGSALYPRGEGARCKDDDVTREHDDKLADSGQKAADLRASLAETIEARVESGDLEDSDLRTRFYRVASALTPFVAIEGESGTFLIPTRGTGSLGRRFFAKQRFDEELIPTALEIARSPSLGLDPRPEQGALFDIGANIGMVAITALRRYGFARAVAFEPHPRNVPVLRANAELSRVGERLQVFDIALGAFDETAHLAAGGTMGKFEILEQGEHAKGGPIDVPMRSIDSLIAAGELRAEDLVLMWMDVQGYEGHVLRGAGRLAPPLVVMELWPTGLRKHDDLDEVRALVEDSYSHVVDLRSNELRTEPISQLGELIEQVGERHTDVLLARV